MEAPDLAYAGLQVLHNFGAVAVLGGAGAARWLAPVTVQRRLAGLVLAGWLLQAASGAGFAGVSYAYYGRLPDLHGIALSALLLKLACAGGGVLLAALYRRRAAGWSPARRATAWSALVALAASALSAAAFLRWFA